MAIPQTIAHKSAPGADVLASLMRPESPETDGTEPLQMPASAPFLLCHHPKNWEVEGEGLEAATWLPVIDVRLVQPGTHGMHTRKKGEAPSEAYKDSVVRDSTRGFQFVDPATSIPAECLPEGVPVGGYRRPVPCRDPRTGTAGLRHLEAWDVPRQYVPGAGPQKTRHDRAAYNRWRLWLVTSGTIAPPSDDVLQAIQQSRSGRAARIAARNPGEIRAAKVAEEKAVTDALETAAIPEPAAEAPVPVRARKGALKVS